MTHLLKLTAVFSAAVIIIPAAVLTGKIKPVSGSGNTSQTIYQKEPVSEKSTVKEASRAVSSYDIKTFSVLNAQTGKVYEIPLRDYVIGAVCAEMPAVFSTEALKAQAVAAHTYAVRQALYERENHTPDLSGADFSDDSSRYQAFFTDDDIRKYYGENYDEYISKVSDAVDSVLDEIIVYEDEPIIAAFHSMSSGYTESSENAWGTPEDYLVPAESNYDKSAPDFKEEYTFTQDEMRSRLETSIADLKLEDDCGEWISILSVSSSGTVLEMKAGNQKITGSEFRRIMNLRSSAFSADFSYDKGFTIVTRGFGHGVGMSQYGANAMAESGKDHMDILLHYYKNAEIIHLYE